MSFFQWPDNGRRRVEQPFAMRSDVGVAEVEDAEDGSQPLSGQVLQRILRFVGFEDQDLADGLTLPLSVQGFGRPVMFLAADRRLELDDGVLEALQVASAVLAVHAPRPEDWGRKAQGLTARERQILSRAASGRNTREIGRDLDMSEGTVARHMSNIRGKLGAANTVQAVVMALRKNEIEV